MEKYDGRANLIRINTRTKSEQKDIATRGGIASGEARRKKKAMKDYATSLLSCLVKDKEFIDQLVQMGLTTEDNNYNFYEAIISAQICKAMKGDAQAFSNIKDIVEPKDDVSGIEKINVVLEMPKDENN